MEEEEQAPESQKPAKNELAYAIALLVTVPLLGVLIIMIMQAPLKNAAQKTAEQQALGVASVMSAAFRQNIGFPTRLQQQASELKANNNQLAEVSVLEQAADGSFSYSASTNGKKSGGSTGDTMLNQTVKSHSQQHQTSTDVHGNQTTVVATPIVEGEQVVAVVKSEHTLDEVTDALHKTIHQETNYAALVLLLMTGLLAYHLVLVQRALSAKDSVGTPDV